MPPLMVVPDSGDEGSDDDDDDESVHLSCQEREIHAEMEILVQQR